MKNPEVAFTWILLGIVMVVLSTSSSIGQRMAIAWGIIIYGFVSLIVSAIMYKKAISNKERRR